MAERVSSGGMLSGDATNAVVPALSSMAALHNVAAAPARSLSGGAASSDATVLQARQDGLKGHAANEHGMPDVRDVSASSSAGQQSSSSGGSGGSSARAAGGGAASGAAARRVGCRDVSEYILERRVGAGTFGVVSKARDPGSGDQVALKKITIDFARETQGFPITALREIRILRTLQHPNIVNLREVVTSKPAAAAAAASSSGADRDRALDRGLGDVFMVFDFSEGDMSGLITMPDAVRSHAHVACYMHQLLAGLAYLHAHNVLHRDLKPANLLMSRRHALRIADFGLAKRWRMGQVMTENVVTPWYRAPELVLGDPYSGPPVDVWSAGCIFLELMTGQPLSRNDRPAELIQDIYALCGAPNPASWPGVDKLKNYRAFLPRKQYTRQVKGKFAKTFPPAALDLLDRMLTLSPAARITAAEALRHPYFTDGGGPPDPASFPLIPFESFHDSDAQAARQHRLVTVKAAVPTLQPAAATAATATAVIGSAGTAAPASGGAGAAAAPPTLAGRKRRLSEVDVDVDVDGPATADSSGDGGGDDTATAAAAAAAAKKVQLQPLVPAVLVVPAVRPMLLPGVPSTAAAASLPSMPSLPGKLAALPRPLMPSLPGLPRPLAGLPSLPRPILAPAAPAAAAASAVAASAGGSAAANADADADADADAEAADGSSESAGADGEASLFMSPAARVPSLPPRVLSSAAVLAMPGAGAAAAPLRPGLPAPLSHSGLRPL